MNVLHHITSSHCTIAHLCAPVYPSVIVVVCCSLCTELHATLRVRTNVTLTNVNLAMSTTSELNFATVIIQARQPHIFIFTGREHSLLYCICRCPVLAMAKASVCPLHPATLSKQRKLGLRSHHYQKIDSYY